MPPTPRTTRLSSAGAILAVACVAGIAGGIGAGIFLYREASTSQRRAALAADAVSVLGRVTSVQLRGDDDDRRTVVQYEYVVNDQSYRGSTRLRRREPHAFVAGGPVAVSHARSDPSVGWIEGHPPPPGVMWPAYLVPSLALVGSAVAFGALRRQRSLLSDGRLAMGTITRVNKKKSDKGTYWRVEYQWKLLNGATRTAHYNHSRKEPPAIGSTLPIIYDRDNPQRQRRYPFPLVSLARR